MKIIIDARVIKSSTGTYVERLLHYIQKLDNVNSYTILIPEKDAGFWKPTAKNFDLKLVNFANYSWSEQTKFKQFLDEAKPDLVHFCMPQQPMFYGGKTVTTFHDLTLLKIGPEGKNPLIHNFKKLVGGVVFNRVAHESDAIICPTNYTKRDLLKFYPKLDPNKITVTYEASDINKVDPQPLKLNFSQFIFYAGRFSRYKNIARLIEAHQKLKTKYPNLGLVLAGPTNDHSYAELKNQIDGKKYQDIQFVGFVSPAELAYIYQRAAAYIFPSFYEGFGLPGLEVMGFGVPLVSSNATCLPEVYDDGALYFDPFSVDDMATKIDLVLSDQELRRQLIERGKKRHASFSWERMAKQTLAVYQKVLDQ